MYGLPRKFNIAFDGGGAISALEDTNDIGFHAVRVGRGQAAVPAASTSACSWAASPGHKDFARDYGRRCSRPSNAYRSPPAMVRVFCEHGDRTDRKKARLKYVLDAGAREVPRRDRKAAAAQTRAIPARRMRAATGRSSARPTSGFIRKSKPGLFYVGVSSRSGGSLPRRCAAWPDRRTFRQRHDPPDRLAEPADLGFARQRSRRGAARNRKTRPALVEASHIRARHWSPAPAMRAASSPPPTPRTCPADRRHLDAARRLDQPINIHLTGCPHSCAQHYIGDIGLIGRRPSGARRWWKATTSSSAAATAEEQQIGREIYRNVIATDAPGVIERMLRAYLEHRASADEAF